MDDDSEMMSIATPTLLSSSFSTRTTTPATSWFTELLGRQSLVTYTFMLGSNDVPKSLNAARPVKQSRLCGIPIASLGRMDELEGLVTDQFDGGVAHWLRPASENYHLRLAGRNNLTRATCFSSLVPIHNIKSAPVNSYSPPNSQ